MSFYTGQFGAGYAVRAMGAGVRKMRDKAAAKKKRKKIAEVREAMAEEVPPATEVDHE